MSNQLHLFSQFFIELGGLLPRFAVLNREFQLLHVQSRHPLDFTSLPLAATQAMQFFNLKDGDLVLLNEPTSGGLGAGDLTWITSVRGLIVGFRESYTTPWTLSAKRDEEGLRIPPTPLRLNGELNANLLEILCQQGNASCQSDTFKQTVLNAIQTSRALSERLSRALELRPEVLDKDQQKKHLAASRNYFLKKILDRVHGETRVDMPLRTGEVLKLKVSSDDDGIKIDFSGSTPGQKLFMPESWTQSAVIAFVMDYINEKEFFNQGSFSSINLIKPQQSFLSAKTQQALAPAQRLGVSSLWSALHLAFFELQPKSFPALHDYFSLQLQWNSQQGPKDFFLPSGSGAFRDRESSSGYLLNRHTRTSLAAFNGDSHFEVIDLHERKLSSQKTALSGGSGWSLKLKILQPVTMHWYGNNIKFPYRFPKNLSAVEPAEILVNNEARNDVMGRLDLQAQDELVLNSGQGAGFNS